MNRSTAGTLSRQLLQRVLLLSLIAVLGLIALIVVELGSSLQATENQLDDTSTVATLNLTIFFKSIEGDLKATSDALTMTSEVNDVLRYTLDRQPAIFELVLVNSRGRVLAQRSRVGLGEQLLNEQPWLETVKAGAIYFGPVDYEKYGVPFIDIAVPVADSNGKFSATLVSRVDLTALWNLINSLKVGKTGYIYVTDQTGRLVAHPDLGLVESGLNIQNVTGHTPQTITESHRNFYTGVAGEAVLASGKSVSIGSWYVIVEQPVKEALLPFVLISAVLFILLIIAGFLVVGVFRFTQNRIVSPLLLLQTGAEELQQGQLKYRIAIQTNDELGKLAGTFNLMAAQLETWISSLEQRVAERTQALSNVAEISTTTSAIRDVQEMLAAVVHLTQRRFNLYHAHVFVFNEATQELEIVACGWKEGNEYEGTHGAVHISLNQEQSLVARAARTKQAVIVNNVRSDPGWLPNPLLPDTASELAVPLLVGETVVGVLDVQSDRLDAFTEQDANIQATLASQVGIALQNARSYAQAEQQRRENELIIRTAGEGIFGLDMRGNHTFVNPAAANMLGYHLEELIGKNSHSLWHHTHADGTPFPTEECPIYATLHDGTIHQGEEYFIRKDGAGFYVSFSSNPIFEEDRVVGAVVTFADITQQKRDQEAIAQRARHQEALNRISQRIQNATSIESALQVTARELGRALGTRTGVQLEAGNGHEEEGVS